MPFAFKEKRTTFYVKGFTESLWEDVDVKQTIMDEVLTIPELDSHYATESIVKEFNMKLDTCK